MALDKIKVNNTTVVNVDKKIGVLPNELTISNELINDRAVWDAFTKVNRVNNLFYVHGWIWNQTGALRLTGQDNEILIFIDVEREQNTEGFSNNKIYFERPLNISKYPSGGFYTSDLQPINFSAAEWLRPIGRYYIDIPDYENIKYFVYYICSNGYNEIGITKIKVCNEREFPDLSNKQYAINLYNIDTRPSKLDEALSSKRLWYNSTNMTDLEIVTTPLFAKNYNYIRNVLGSSTHYTNQYDFKITADDIYGTDISNVDVNDVRRIRIMCAGLYNDYAKNIQIYANVFYGVSETTFLGWGYTYSAGLSYNTIQFINDNFSKNNYNENINAETNCGNDVNGIYYYIYDFDLYPEMTLPTGQKKKLTGITINATDYRDPTIGKHFNMMIPMVGFIDNGYGFNCYHPIYTLKDRLYNPNISDDNEGFKTGDVINPFTGKIREALLPETIQPTPQPEPQTNEYILDLVSSDKMLFYGNSYTESAYTIKNKSWINVLTNFVEMPLMNFGVSGRRVVDLTQFMRTNRALYGSVGPNEIKPSHIVIENIGNDTSQMLSEDSNLEIYLLEIQEAIENIKALRAKPIIGTDWENFNNNLVPQLDAYAKDNGILFCPVGLGLELSKRRYAGFWGGGHPATRTNATVYNEWYRFLKNISADKSIKIFRCRSAYANSSIEQLNYDTLYQRFQKFIEIGVGERALTESDNSWQYYDKLNVSGYNISSYPNEYSTIINGETITMTKWSLIEFIIPVTRPENVEITIVSPTSGLSFYLKNPNYPTDPYDHEREHGAFEVTKDVYNGFDVTPGTKFTSSATSSNELTYRGKSFSDAMNGYYLFFDAPATVGETGSGNLVNKSTSATTPYIRTNYNLSRYSYGFYSYQNKPVGRFISVESSYASGTYTISVPEQYISYDKIRLIISSSSNFLMGMPSCTITGGFEKIKNPYPLEYKFGSSQSLLQTTGFGSSSFNNEWEITEGVYYEKMPSEYNDYPGFNNDCSHLVLGMNSDGFPGKVSKTFTVPSSRGYRKVQVRLTARLFPKIYTGSDGTYTTSTRQITEDSCDQSRLQCQISTTNIAPAVSYAFVGPGWAEHLFEFIIAPLTTSFKIRFNRCFYDFYESEKLTHNWPM